MDRQKYETLEQKDRVLAEVYLAGLKYGKNPKQGLAMPSGSSGKKELPITRGSVLTKYLRRSKTNTTNNFNRQIESLDYIGFLKSYFDRVRGKTAECLALCSPGVVDYIEMVLTNAGIIEIVPKKVLIK
jgi:hypothetical protein